MKDWGWVAAFFLLELMQKPAFWICLSIVVAGNIIGSAVTSAGESISMWLEELHYELSATRKEREEDWGDGMSKLSAGLERIEHETDDNPDG